MLTVVSHQDFEAVVYIAKTDIYDILVFYPSTHNYGYKNFSIG